jgi:hypothetical protein
MTVSLRRKLCLSVVFFLIASEAKPIDLSYSASFSSRVGVHLAGDLAINRHTLEVQQTAKWLSSWSANAGARIYADSAFAMNDRYNAPVRGIESQEFAPRDIYVQYKNRGIQFRIGNQQVVWGESFGFFFADIVNPKDTREGGLGGDLAAQRIMVPMVNFSWYQGNYALQLLYIPKPFLNLTPAQGSDFAVPLSQFFPGFNVSLSDERILPLALSSSEFGIRGTAILGGWDMGAFFLSYFDRRPSYRPSFTATDVLIRGVHDRIASLGLTATKDFDSWVSRLELIYTRSRPVDAFVLNPTAPTQSFSTSTSDEFVGVLGFDYTQWRDWRLTLQVSQDSFLRAVPGSLLPQHATNLSFVLGGTLFRNHELTVIQSYCVNDGSALSQLLYMMPLSSRLEATLGTYLFTGGSSSSFGTFRGASRVFLQLKGYFGAG